MSGNKKKLLKLDFPIFGIASFEDYLIVSGGGGGKKYGLKNKIIVLKRQLHQGKIVNQKTFELETAETDIIENLQINQKQQLVTGNSEENAIFYSIIKNKDTIELKEIQRLRTDYSLEDACQNDGKFNLQFTQFAAGGSDSIIRVFKVDYQKDKLSLKFDKQMELAYHTDSINFIDFHPTKQLLISASDDKTCRIFNLEKKIQIQKLSFSDVQSFENYKFHSCYFSRDGSQIYTVQNPMRGPSYYSVWEFQDKDVVHKKDLKLHNFPTTSSTINAQRSYIGIGTGDGAAKILDIENNSIRTQNHVHDMVIKGISFSTDNKYLVTGTPEFDLDFLKNQKQTSKFLQAIIVIVIGWLLSWALHTLF